MTDRPRLVILTEGDRRRGLGHVTRTSAYAEHWRSRGGDVAWVLDGDDDAARIASQTGEVDRRRWQDDADRTTVQSAVTIVDSYALSPVAIQALAAREGAVVFIDDLQTHRYPTGVVVVHPALDPAPRRPDAATWLIGPQWHPLRPAFLSNDESRSTSKIVERVLVLMGGTDVRRLSGPMVHWVAQTCPDAAIDVVGGDPEQGTNPNLIAHQTVAAGDMAALMRNADVAISAAGTTILELAHCGTPTLMIAVADNQQSNLDHWPDLCGFIAAGRWDDPALGDGVIQGLEALRDPAARADISRRARQVVDGAGVARLFARIMPSGDQYRP